MPESSVLGMPDRHEEKEHRLRDPVHLHAGRNDRYRYSEARDDFSTDHAVYRRSADDASLCAGEPECSRPAGEGHLGWDRQRCCVHKRAVLK